MQHIEEIERQRQGVIARFRAACQANDRVVAAFLGGSYARGATDAYSDIDFGLITTDAGYATFFADRAAFIGQLGEPIFHEVWQGDAGGVVFFTLAAGSRAGIECELMLGRVGDFRRMHVGPHQVLLDPTHLLDGVAFTQFPMAPAEEAARARHLVVWFWHDLCHHVITPLAREQWWSAYGGLQDLRLTCLNLARLTADPAGPLDGYEKVERAVPAEQLDRLAPTCCALERGAMLQAAATLVQYYQELAVPLARQHGFAYPTALAAVMTARLAGLRADG
jgi:predicted nucleotidyltransferase